MAVFSHIKSLNLLNINWKAIVMKYWPPKWIEIYGIFCWPLRLYDKQDANIKTPLYNSRVIFIAGFYMV